MLEKTPLEIDTVVTKCTAQTEIVFVTKAVINLSFPNHKARLRTM